MHREARKAARPRWFSRSNHRVGCAPERIVAHPRRSPEKRFAIGSQIVTAKRPRKRHYGEIIDDPANPPDYEAATDRARQIIQRRPRSPD